MRATGSGEARCAPREEGPAATDVAAGFHVLDHFERFSQKNDIYSRAFWDPDVRSDRTDRFFDTYRTPLKKWKTAEGFRQKDYALRNASWHLPDIFAELKESENRREGFLDSFTVHGEAPPDRVPVESPAEMSREIKHVAKVFGADLVGIAEYDERWVYTHSYSRLGETEKPQELPADLSSVIVIAQEMDRELTDLPLTYDLSQSFGVTEFCNTCRRCSDACPVNAIPSGPPSDEVFNRSNQNSDCSICVRVCPYNRGFSGRWARCWRWLAGTRVRRFALWLADVFAPGDRVSPDVWWNRGARRARG